MSAASCCRSMTPARPSSQRAPRDLDLKFRFPGQLRQARQNGQSRAQQASEILRAKEAGYSPLWLTHTILKIALPRGEWREVEAIGFDDVTLLATRTAYFGQSARAFRRKPPCSFGDFAHPVPHKDHSDWRRLTFVR